MVPRFVGVIVVPRPVSTNYLSPPELPLTWPLQSPGVALYGAIESREGMVICEESAPGAGKKIWCHQPQPQRKIHSHTGGPRGHADRSLLDELVSGVHQRRGGDSILTAFGVLELAGGEAGPPLTWSLLRLGLCLGAGGAGREARR